MKRQIAVLGSTGSIGRQTLEVVAEHPDLFEIYMLTANSSVDLLCEQAPTFMPGRVVIPSLVYYNHLKDALADLTRKVCCGIDAI